MEFLSNLYKEVMVNWGISSYDANNENLQLNGNGKIIDDDMLLKVFSYMELKEANTISLVCRHWRKTNESNPVYLNLFQILVKKHFPNSEIQLNAEKSFRENMLLVQRIVKQTANELLEANKQLDLEGKHSFFSEAFVDYNMKNGSVCTLSFDHIHLTLNFLGSSEISPISIKTKRVKSARLLGDYILCNGKDKTNFSDWVQVYSINDLKKIELEAPQENGNWLNLCSNHSFLCAISANQMVTWDLETGKIIDTSHFGIQISECKGLKVGKKVIAAFVTSGSDGFAIRIKLNSSEFHMVKDQLMISSDQKNLAGLLLLSSMTLTVLDLDEDKIVFDIGILLGKEFYSIALTPHFHLENGKLAIFQKPIPNQVDSIVFPSEEEPNLDLPKSVMEYIFGDIRNNLLILEPQKWAETITVDYDWRSFAIFHSSILFSVENCIYIKDLNNLDVRQKDTQLVQFDDSFGMLIRFDSYLDTTGCVVAVFEKGVRVIEFKSISQLFKKESNKND